MDKGKVEAGVLLVQRWILARLRRPDLLQPRRLNAAIRVLLDALNDRPMQKLASARRTLYEQLDRPALRPLPADRYVLAHWKLCRVNIDYHVVVERHVYSVPFPLLRRAGRGPLHDDDRRGLLQGPARDVAPATLRRAAVHPGRAHAQRPSRPRRVDAVAPHPLGREGRTRNRSTRRPHPAEPPTSGAGVSSRPWGSCVWGGSTATPRLDAASAPRPGPRAPAATTPSRTSSPPARTGSLWSRRPSRRRRQHTPTSAAPTTTPRPPGEDPC